MRLSSQKLKAVVLARNIHEYKIKVKGPHLGLYNKQGKWIQWLTKKEAWELKDLGVQ